QRCDFFDIALDHVNLDIAPLVVEKRHRLLLVIYSQRSATIGSTFVVRRAGIQQATSATAINNNEITTNVSGSVALTPKRSFRINRVKISDASSPHPTPASVSFSPCRKTSRRTSRDCAPSATRMPTSCVRLATKYEMTP